MIRRHPGRRIAVHAVLIAGVLLVVAPVWFAFVVSTHPGADFLSGNLSVLPGPDLVKNYRIALVDGDSTAGLAPVGRMLWNSFVMAMIIACGKIAISFISAFAIAWFRFPFRTLAFWLIFVTLMLPVEVRILPTYSVVASLGMLNSYAGLTVPIVASATATFLFRQVFMTIPEELTEAARIDGAGPLRFLKDMVVPLSRTNMAALFIILFIYGWNQYLWPLLVTTGPGYETVVMGIQRLAQSANEGRPYWHLVMATAILAMLPPIAIVVGLQKLFVKGLVETEK